MREDIMQIEARLAAFAFLDAQRRQHGDDVLPWALLLHGFEHQGQRIALLSMQGIFKPRSFTLPLSIRTAAEEIGKPRPYDDDLGRDGVIAYRYRGKDPKHPENVGLGELYRRRIPLIYFHGIVPGLYLPIYPVTIVGNDPSQLTCMVQVDEPGRMRLIGGVADLSEFAIDEGAVERRRYTTASVQVRVHQQSFRTRVLRAYSNHCAICQLRHRELLDAAHIISDGHERGVAEVFNGLALCKLHHAAFDSNLIGIQPDLIVDVREDLRRETDGPMLLHGLQGIHGQKIRVPRRSDLKPKLELLDERFTAYREAAG